jgi:iron complex transport system substrate-binding protein
MHRGSRRSFVKIAAGAAAGLALTGPILHGVAAQEASPAASGWVFVDDRGRTIELPERPTRIFADAMAALSLWEFGIKPVGVFGYLADFTFPEEWGEVEKFDQGSGEIDIERMIVLDPDISIGFTWDVNSKSDFGAVEESTMPGFTDVAPTLCILAVQVPVSESIERFAELAAALGADVEGAEISGERDAFLAASEAVRSAAAAKPGLKVLAISGYGSDLWVGNPKAGSDLVYFTELGVNMIAPEAPDEYASGLFQQLSWEQLNQYPADVYLIDNRASVLSVDELMAMPTFSLLPAAKARQFAPWPVEYVTSYAGVTPILAALAEAIENAEIVTG